MKFFLDKILPWIITLLLLAIVLVFILKVKWIYYLFYIVIGTLAVVGTTITLLANKKK